MKSAVRILLLKDNNDPLPLKSALRDAELDPLIHEVENFSAFKAALCTSEWDVILCDEARAGFGGVSIPVYLKEKKIDLPCIVLAETAQEHCIVQAIKEGAHDYVVKGNLSRLAPAIRREVDAARERSQRREAEGTEGTRAKNHFVSTLSHELRTPMTVFMGMVELAQGTELSREQHYYLSTAMASAEKLLRIIEDLLDFAQMKRGEMKFATAPFNLRNCIDQAMEKAALSGKKKGLTITLHAAEDLPETILGDAHRLRQALESLLGNAVKFTERGHIAVSVCVDSDPAVLRIAVRDTGIGIPEDKQRLIFQSFTQLDDTNIRRFDGLGLGLALTRRIAEGMGGTLEVSSRIGSGSEFRLLLPLNLRPSEIHQRFKVDAVMT